MASALTFFSGFGLGTLLLPAFAVFVPIEQAVGLTAVVHLLNNIFKLTLVGRYAARGVVLGFGLPAIATSFLGAWALLWLADMSPSFSYSAFGAVVAVTPAKFVVGLLLLAFASLELSPRFRALAFEPRYMPIGGLLSGFFGGLSGMQGALRSAFLTRVGLSKEAFIGTGVVVATLIDLPRITIYSLSMPDSAGLRYSLLAAAVLAAFLGAVIGNTYLKKVTMPGIRRTVALMLFAVSLGLISGLL